MRLKYLTQIKASNVDKTSVEGEIPVRLCNYVDVYRNDVITEDLEFMEATATPAQIQEFSLHSGDVVITKDSETPEDIAVPALVPGSLSGVLCGYHLSILRPLTSIIQPRYLYWTLLATPIRADFKVHAKGVTRFGLGYGEIGDTPIPLPPLDEQRAIVRFLDEQTAKIDMVVQKKEALIAAYERHFEALGVHLLRPDVRPMEPLRRVSGGVTVGVVVNPSSYVEPEGPVPYFRGIDVKPYQLDVASAQRISAESNLLLSKSRLRECDIVTVRDGDPGTSAVVPAEADGANCASLLITRKGSRVDSRYLCHVFNSRFGRSQFASLAYGAAQRHVNVSDAVTFRVPMVAPEEQRAIADELDHEWVKLSELRQLLRQQVRLLGSFRSTLITAAVTGQIDVTKAG